MKKILFSLMAILLAVGLVGAGAFAYFSDIETSEGNTFTAGTLDLTVGGQNPCTEHITISNIAPERFYASRVYKVKNIGTLDGALSIGISEIINNDNGLTEPESEVDSTGGDGEGELGRNLCFKMMRVNPDAIIFYWKRLNDWGGITQTTAGGNPMILHAGEEWDIKLEFKLSAGGNELQSDSVEFDIIFHLDQA